MHHERRTRLGDILGILKAGALEREGKGIEPCDNRWSTVGSGCAGQIREVFRRKSGLLSTGGAGGKKGRDF